MPRAAEGLCVQCDTERAWQRRICPKCGKTKTKPVPVVVVDASPDDSCNEDDRALDLVAETSEAAAEEDIRAPGPLSWPNSIFKSSILALGESWRVGRPCRAASVSS